MSGGGGSAYHPGSRGFSSLRAYPQPAGGFLVECLTCGLIVKSNQESIIAHLLTHEIPPSAEEMQAGAESGKWPNILSAQSPSVVLTPPLLTGDPVYSEKKEDINEGAYQCKHCLATYLNKQGFKSHMRRAKHPGKPAEGLSTVRALALNGIIRFVDTSLERYTAAWGYIAAKHILSVEGNEPVAQNNVQPTNRVADAKAPDSAPKVKAPTLQQHKSEPVRSQEDVKASSSEIRLAPEVKVIEPSDARPVPILQAVMSSDRYSDIDLGDFVFAADSKNNDWSFREAAMKIKLPPHLHADGKSHYFITKYLKGEAFFSQVNICSDASIRDTFEAVKLERSPTELQNRLFMRPEDAQSFCREADSNLMSMLPNDRADARVITSELREKRPMVAYHEKLKRVAGKTLNAYSYTLVKFMNLLLRKHNLTARLSAAGQDVNQLDAKSIITGSLIWVLKLPSVTATTVLKQFIAGCGIGQVGQIGTSNPSWYFNRPGSIAKRLSHLLRFAQYAIIANTRHNAQRTAKENEAVAKSLQQSSFLNGLRDTIATLRHHEAQTMHQQEGARPEIDENGNHNARMSDGSIVTRHDMANAADSLFETARSTVTRLIITQLAACPAITDSVLDQCADTYHRSPFREGMGRTDKIQVVIETMLEHKLHQPLRYDHITRGNGDTERFIIMNSWWNNPLLNALQNREGFVDANLDAWGSLIALLHMTNGTPPRPEDYCLFDAPLLKIGGNGKIVWNLDVTKTSAKIASANFSMSDACSPLVLLYLRLFQSPSSPATLNHFSFKTCLTLRLSAAFGRQMLCEEEYRKVAAIFATFLAQDAMKDPSQASGLTLLTKILQELMGHTDNTHLSSSYVGSIISPITSEAWRRFVLLQKPDSIDPVGISKFREDFSTTFASQINQGIAKLTANLNGEKKREMEAFLRGCADLQTQKVIAYFPCGWGKKTGAEFMGSLARDTDLKMKVLHVVPNNFLAREQAQPGFAANLLGVRAVAWTDRLSMDSVGDEIDVVTVNFEQVMSDNFQKFYNQGRSFLCVIFDEAHEILEGWNWRPAVRRAAMVLSAGGTVPIRYLTGSMPLAQRHVLKALLPHHTPPQEFGGHYGVVDETKAILVEKCSSESDMLQRTIATAKKHLETYPRSKVFVTCMDYAQVDKYVREVTGQLGSHTKVATLSKRGASYCDLWMDAENTGCRILIGTSLGNTGITCVACDLVIGPGLRSTAQLLQAEGRAGRGVAGNGRPIAKFVLFHCREYVTRKFGARDGGVWLRHQAAALAGVVDQAAWQAASELYGPDSIERLVGAKNCFRVHLAWRLDKKRIRPCQICNNCTNGNESPSDSNVAQPSHDPLITHVDEKTWQVVRDGFLRLQARCAYCSEAECKVIQCSRSRHAQKDASLWRCCVCCFPPATHSTVRFCERIKPSMNGVKCDLCPQCFIPLENLAKFYGPMRQYTSRELHSTRLGDELAPTVHATHCAGKTQVARDRIRNAISSVVAFGPTHTLKALGFDLTLTPAARAQKLWVDLQKGQFPHTVPLLAASMRFLPNHPPVNSKVGAILKRDLSGNHPSVPSKKAKSNVEPNLNGSGDHKSSDKRCAAVMEQSEPGPEEVPDVRDKHVAGEQPIAKKHRVDSNELPPVVDITTISECLRQVFKRKQFRSNQLEAVTSILSGQNVLLVKRTGGGKSLTYQLPGVIPGRAPGIIVCPLLSLSTNQIYQLRETYNINAESLTSETKISRVDGLFDDLKAGAVRLLYTTPEQLAKSSVQRRFSDVKIGYAM